MLVLPMSSPSSSPSRQRDASPYSPRAQREETPQTSELRKQVANTMLSVMPPTSPPNPRRPKLSLQTSLAPSLAGPKRPALSMNTTDSPTTRNTQANKFDAPPPTPSSAIQPKVQFPSLTATAATPPSSAPSQGPASPYPHDAPYNLPIGTHGILRNSPIPKRHLSATSSRASKRMFSPTKRVAFSERLVELAPTPVIEEAEEDEANASLTEEQHEERRTAIQEEDGHSSAGQRRRKKRREWIWRPMEDDVLTEHRQEDAALSAGGEVDEETSHASY